jgi:hypothetical protein
VPPRTFRRDIDARGVRIDGRACGTEPAARARKTNSGADLFADFDSNYHGDADSRCHSDRDVDADTNNNTNSHVDGCRDSDANSDINGYAYGDTDAHARYDDSDQALDRRDR